MRRSRSLRTWPDSWQSLRRTELRRAIGAASGRQRNAHRTVTAFLGCGCCRRLGQNTVHPLDKHEYSEGDDQKLNHGVQKGAVVDGNYMVGLSLSQGVMEMFDRQGENEAGEVNSAD